MADLHDRFLTGAAARHADMTSEVAEQIWEKLAAFANYGFPESHSVSFAHLVYASAWIKLHHPSAFCAGPRPGANTPIQSHRYPGAARHRTRIGSPTS